MSQHEAITERSVLVFTSWAVLGFFGLALFLEGLDRDALWLCATGVAAIVLTFVSHIVINGIFQTGFSSGEAALGIAGFGLLGLTFVLGAIGGGLSMTDYYGGLMMFGSLASGFLVYLLTRHGLRGAFSRFHHKSAYEREG